MSIIALLFVLFFSVKGQYGIHYALYMRDILLFCNSIDAIFQLLIICWYCVISCAAFQTQGWRRSRGIP